MESTKSLSLGETPRRRVVTTIYSVFQLSDRRRRATATRLFDIKMIYTIKYLHVNTLHFMHASYRYVTCWRYYRSDSATTAVGAINLRARTLSVLHYVRQLYVPDRSHVIHGETIKILYFCFLIDLCTRVLPHNSAPTPPPQHMYNIND